MKASYIFKQLTWLVKTIKEERKISLKDLSEKWSHAEESDGNFLSRSTFNRQRD